MNPVTDQTTTAPNLYVLSPSLGRLTDGAGARCLHATTAYGSPPLPTNSEIRSDYDDPEMPEFAGRGGLRMRGNNFAQNSLKVTRLQHSSIAGTNVTMEAPHPPTPSPREFGQRLTALVRRLIRIHEERGSQDNRSCERLFFRSLLPLLSILIIGALACPITIAQSSKDKDSARLIWRSGDSVPGKIESFADNKLSWQAGTLFGQPLEIDSRFLRKAEFPLTKSESQESEPFIVQLIDGMSMTGQIVALDDEVLTIESERFGEVKIDRQRVATVLNLKNSGSLINGQFDLDKWNAHRGEKKYWSVDEQGALQSGRKNIHLYFKSDLPDSVLIEMEIGWEKSLDFSFGFGVPSNARKIGDLPRLESWDGAIVLSFGDDFETVLESVDETTKRLKLLIHWNRAKHQIVIHDEKGLQLAQAALGEPGKKTCLLYTSPSPRDATLSRMPSSA